MTTRRNSYEVSYARIEALLKRPLVDLESEDVIRLRAPGYMDLVVEVLLPRHETGATVILMAYYFEQNDDLCQDPEMTVRLFHRGSTVFRVMTPSSGSQHGRAEVLTFMQAIPPVYQVIYPEPGRYLPRLRRDLNAFLGQWLRNLKVQGHRPVDTQG